MQIILAFLLMIINVVAGILPAVLLILLFLYDGIQITHFNLFIFGIEVVLFCISFILCLYIVLDILFGFTVFSKTSKLKGYKFSMRYGKICHKPFEEIKTTFRIPTTNLLISPDIQEKAYTVASIGKSFICVTTGALDSLRMKCQTDEEFQEVFKGLIARQAIILTEGHHLVQAVFEINTSVTKLTKWTNSLFFKLFGKALSIIPVVGVALQKICNFANKGISFILECINIFLVVIYKVITSITAGIDDSYCDEKASEIVGGKIVAKALSFTEKADYKLFSTATNIHKRIKKIAGIEKKLKPQIGGSLPKIMVFIAIISLFALVFWLAYQIKIWRIFHLTELFLDGVKDVIS